MASTSVGAMLYSGVLVVLYCCYLQLDTRLFGVKAASRLVFSANRNVMELSNEASSESSIEIEAVSSVLLFYSIDDGEISYQDGLGLDTSRRSLVSKSFPSHSPDCMYL